jgi:uncharacterized protein YbaA (DUF1428 family)
MDLDNAIYKSSTKKTISMQTNLPPDLANKVKDLAKAEMLSDSRMIRIILKRWFNLKEMVIGDKNDR